MRLNTAEAEPEKYICQQCSRGEYIQITLKFQILLFFRRFAIIPTLTDITVAFFVRCQWYLLPLVGTWHLSLPNCSPISQ